MIPHQDMGHGFCVCVCVSLSPPASKLQTKWIDWNKSLHENLHGLFHIDLDASPNAQG
jgi:hypothetical protein